MEFVPSLLGIASLAPSIALVICVALWLLFCRYVIRKAIKQGHKIDPQQMINAASRGPIHLLGERPRLPPKSDEK